jgi:hypothetical protein
MTERVSPEQRKANSKACAKRNQWRRQYAALTTLIRESKSSESNRKFNYEAVLKLRILREKAKFMMIQHGVIKKQLRETGYKYVSEN